MKRENYINKLHTIKKDQYQYEAFNSDTNTVVIAGPGSGKTTILTLKVIDLLDNKIKPPRGLACITYNKETVKEFTQRLLDYGYRKRNNVFLGTVHAFCISEIITPFAELYNYDRTLPLKIISEKEKEKLFNEIVTEFNLESAKLKVSEMDKERKLKITGLSSIAIESHEVALKVALEYEKRLSNIDKVDFEEIVNYATLLIQTRPYVRKCLEAKFPWILIDEYQDLGKPLHEMILALFDGTDIKIFAVGDPDQSIYSFSGAMPDYLIELKNNSNFNDITLKTNYRSNQEIINASIAALNINERDYTAGLRKEEKAQFNFIVCEKELDDQYEQVIKKIIPKCIEEGIPLNEICILMGRKEQLKELASKMKDATIPYYISVYNFQRSELIIWLENCAKWVSNNKQQGFDELLDFWLEFLSKHNYTIANNSIFLIRRSLFDLLTSTSSQELSSWLETIFDELKLKELLKYSHIYPDELDNLDLFYDEIICGSLSGKSVEEFSNIGRPNNQITLSTRHSSKGLEFEVVVMLGMEEGSFPFKSSLSDPRKIQEEHRLFFVCISRAKRICYLLRSKNLTIYSEKYDRHYKLRNLKPSIFWDILFQKYGKK